MSPESATSTPGEVVATSAASTAASWPEADPALDALFAEVIGTPEGRRDPYTRYRALREAAPVYSSGLGMVVCTRYEECQMVLRDSRLGKGQGGERDDRVQRRFGHLEVFPRIEKMLSRGRSLLFLDPPDHTRLRSLVSKAFTPRTVEALRPAIEALVDGLLDEVPTGEPVDVMGAFAFPLPANVISTMLGVPESDWPQFRPVMSQATLLLEPVLDDDELEEALLAQLELEDYFKELVASRRGHLRDDLLSQLITVQEGTDRLSESELISTVILLFGAGFETTTNLIGNGLYALLTHPAELALLRDDLVSASSAAQAARAPDAMAVMRPCVEELLRWDSPVQFDGRQAYEDLDISGVGVASGREVVTVLGAANRDPEHFSDPDRLDLHRDEGPPMSFASGIHYCLGAALARAEGQIAFGQLLRRYRKIELATETPAWKNRITLRGLAELPVVCSTS